MTSSDHNAQYPVLSKINYPGDLRRLALTDIPQASADLRAFLLNSVAQCGGHFAAGLGVIELTIALHYVLSLIHI